MFSFLFPKKRNGIYSVCVVNSTGVSVAVVQLFSDRDTYQKPVVLFSTEIQSTPSGSETTAIIAALRACKQVTTSFREHICMIDDVRVDVQQREIVYEKGRTFTVNEKLVHELIARDQSKIEEIDYRKKLAPGKPLVDINGYRVTRFTKDSRGDSLEIRYLHGAIDTQLFSNIKNCYETVFHSDHVTVVPFAYSYYHALDADSWEHSLMYATSGEESTIMYFTRGILRHQQKIPIGLAGIRGNIARAFKIPERHVTHITSLAQDIQLLRGARDVSVNTLAEIFQEPGTVIEQAFHHVKNQVFQMPGHITVIDPVEWFSVYHGILGTIFGKKIVSPYHHIIHKITQAHGVHTPSLPLALAILWVFYNRT